MTESESADDQGILSTERETVPGMTLRPWQEIVGIFQGAFIEGHFLILELRIGRKRVRLSFDAENLGTEPIRTSLRDVSTGTKIGITMTDAETETLLFREVRE